MWEDISVHLWEDISVEDLLAIRKKYYFSASFDCLLTWLLKYTLCPQIIAGNMRPNSFNVSYTPKFAGEYEIWVQCGNIVINSGNPYKMTVSTGLIPLLYIFSNSISY